MEKTKIVIALLVACTCLAGAVLLAGGMKQFKSGVPQISVTGMAEKNITSDLIVWNITVSNEGNTRGEAYTGFEHAMQKVRQYLLKQGLQDSTLTTASVDFSKKEDSFYDQRAGKYISVDKGFVVSQTLTVSSREIEKVEKVYRKISELYGEGLTFTSSAPDYYYTQLNNLKMEMLKEAGANAYERAKTIAEGSKEEVGEMVSANMGVFQIVGLNSNEEYSWGGTLNTSSKEKVASITVRASFKVK